MKIFNAKDLTRTPAQVFDAALEEPEKAVIINHGNYKETVFELSSRKRAPLKDARAWDEVERAEKLMADLDCRKRESVRESKPNSIVSEEYAIAKIREDREKALQSTYTQELDSILSDEIKGDE